MARLNIIKQDNPLIRQTSKIVDDFSPHLHEILDNMYETLLHANGMGLAAVQVGILYRMAIILTEEFGTVEIINPVIKTAKNPITARLSKSHIGTLEFSSFALFLKKA